MTLRSNTLLLKSAVIAVRGAYPEFPIPRCGGCISGGNYAIVPQVRQIDLLGSHESTIDRFLVIMCLVSLAELQNNTKVPITTQHQTGCCAVLFIAMDDYEQTDVLICGCGPTGAMLSGYLGKMGIRNIVLEKEPDITTDPRGIALDDDGIRALQGLGLYEHVFVDIGSG